MKKNVSKIIIFIVIGFFLKNDLLAAEKKDVTDPVLREVISVFSRRMPRFINKYGPDVFVADEKITRGGLLLALYEYDKLYRDLKENFVSNLEFRELSNRLASIERRITQREEVPKLQLDISSIINELQPNMPIILRNTKEFTKLEEDVSLLKKRLITPQQPLPDQFVEDIKKDIDKTKTDIKNIEERLSKIERHPTDIQPSELQLYIPTILKNTKELKENISLLEKRLTTIEKIPDQLAKDIKKDLDKTKTDIKNIEERLNKIEELPVGTQLNNIQAHMPTVLKHTKEFTKLKEDISLLKKRLTMIEKIPDKFTENIKKDLHKTKTDIKNIEERLVKLERAPSGIGTQEGLILTKISIVLSATAALFMAR